MSKHLPKVFFSLILIAITIPFALQADDIDVSSQRQIVEDLGLPSIPRLAALLAKADSSYNASDWTTAIILYDRVAQESNWLANILSSAASPYYSASADELNGFSALTGAELVPAETASNEYKHTRNIALSRIGFCYEKLGKPKDAIPYLLKSLELLTIEEDSLWKETREALYRLIQFSP